MIIITFITESNTGIAKFNIPWIDSNQMRRQQDTRLKIEAKYDFKSRKANFNDNMHASNDKYDEKKYQDRRLKDALRNK